MRGISPETQELIPFGSGGNSSGHPRASPAYARILKGGTVGNRHVVRKADDSTAFENMRMVAEAAGATVGDCIRLVV